MFYRTEKAGRSRVNVFEVKSGEYVCQLMTREVAGWLHKAEAARLEDAEFEARARAERSARVRDYLAKRAVREASRPVQLSMF